MKRQIIEYIRKAVTILMWLVFFSGLTGCENKTNTEEMSSWLGETSDDELAELEKVEHEGEVVNSTSVINETNGSDFVYVYVCGKVNRPGVYELPGKSRIYEAIECAGGMTEEASVEAVNQALLVEDGMQITVPGKDEVILQEIKEQQSGLVNLNTADIDTLTTLKGIGRTRAEAIVSYREENGSFKAKEDVMNVPGIKQGAYEKIKDSITVY